MNNYNCFELLIDVVFSMSPQLGGYGTKTQELVISFSLGKGETFPKFHLRALQVRGENFLLKDETGKIGKLTGKYIMELSKVKHIQFGMTTFELDYRNFEWIPQLHQLSTTLQSTIKEVFETLETEDVSCQQSIPWMTLFSTETSAIPFITRVEKIIVNTTIKTKVDSINPYPIKDHGPYQLHI